jgi:hypothetical protein
MPRSSSLARCIRDFKLTASVPLHHMRALVFSSRQQFEVVDVVVVWVSVSVVHGAPVGDFSMHGDPYVPVEGH